MFCGCGRVGVDWMKEFVVEGEGLGVFWDSIKTSKRFGDNFLGEIWEFVLYTFGCQGMEAMYEFV